MAAGVTMICLDCSETEIEKKIRETEYANLKTESALWKTDGLRGVFRIILAEENPYICFAQSGKISDSDKVQKMVDFLEKNKHAGSVLCRQEYIEEDGTHVGWMHKPYMRMLVENGEVLNGTALLELSLDLEENLFGSLECCMIRRSIFINKDFLLNYFDCIAEEEKLVLMFECLYGMNVGHIRENLVRYVERDFNFIESYQDYRIFDGLREKIYQQVYKKKSKKKKGLPQSYLQYPEGKAGRRSRIGKVKKEVTLFYMDKAEYYNLEPIGKEAERRGYQVIFSEELGKEAEVGIYCSHVGCLQGGGYEEKKAKLSLIMLHDMTQGELDWPDLWNDEPWEWFDIGILPGETWAQRWQTCSGFRYAHPKLGVYEIGYPKSDCVKDERNIVKSEALKKSLGMKYDLTVLYAPSWENDGKEEDFVRALQDMPVNLLIKQNAYIGYPVIADNAKKMRQMHEGKYDNIYYIDPFENIMNVYPICDLVISDESGALTEALLFGKSSIAVTNWLIPDVEPPRFSAVPFDYVHKCRKEELRETAEKVLDNIKSGREEGPTSRLYSHIGETSSMIMDLIDYYIGQSDDASCLETEIMPTRRLHGLWD